MKDKNKKNPITKCYVVRKAHAFGTGKKMCKYAKRKSLQ